MSITCFDGEFAFLSNFSPSPVFLDGVAFPTVEHAFQAAKTLDPAERDLVLAAVTPGRAKRVGRRVTLRPDWEEVRLLVMGDLLQQKFAFGTALARSLLATGDTLLIEGNAWHDTFWGVCDGVGKNHLGRLLMAIRANLFRSSMQGVSA